MDRDFWKRLVLGLTVASLALAMQTLHAQEAADDAGETEVVMEEETPAEAQDKLWPVTRLDQAFLKANRSRAFWAQELLRRRQRVEEAQTDTERDALKQDIATAERNFRNIHNAMAIVFGVGNRRQYEYNPINSTVYLVVGRVDQAFSKGVRTLNSLRGFVQRQNTLKEAETDEKKLEEIDGQIKTATRQYNVVAASMQLIFGYAQTRNYQYNPANSTLYLKITDTELEKLQDQLRARQDDTEEADAGADAPEEAAPAEDKAE